MFRSICPKLVKTKTDFPKEADGNEVKYETSVFRNWGKTVENHPAYLFYPRTIEGISHIITWAKKIGKTVRVAAYRHSWSHLFSDNDQVLISLLDKNEAELLPAQHKLLDHSNPFQSIELVGKEFKEDGKIKHLCKIGPATTNEQFRQWVINSFNSKGSKASWTVPSNVVMVESTFGGTTSVACHGAGPQNKTISDIVTEIEFVNPYGKLQKVGYKITDPEEKQQEGKELIKTASACFGMLGVVTSITVKLDQLTHARMKPVKPRLALAVPPPRGYVLPKEVPIGVMQDVTTEDLKKAEAEFISNCENSYYSEWFWFSLHDKCWVNCWKNDGLEKDSKDFPTPFTSKLQEIEEYLVELSNQSIMKLLPAKWQATLLSDAAMLSLPAEQEVTMPLIDGLHFQRGIQNMRALDMEFQIPIPALPNGKPDWNICRRAWWDAIVTVYEWMEKKNKIPMRLPLEMRVMNGSNVTMAPESGNTLGTCCIEVLTVGNDLVDPYEWKSFMQDIVDKWSKYTDFTGKPLNIRPHWAKQWEGLTIKRTGEVRKDIIDYMKEDAYKDQIIIYKKHLDTIAKQGGYSLDDLRLFSNPLLDNIFYHIKSKKKEIETKQASPLPHFDEESSELAYSEEEIIKLQSLIAKMNLAHRTQQNCLREMIKDDKSQEITMPVSQKALEPSKNGIPSNQALFVSLHNEMQENQKRLALLEDKLKMQYAQKNRSSSLLSKKTEEDLQEKTRRCPWFFSTQRSKRQVHPEGVARASLSLSKK